MPGMSQREEKTAIIGELIPFTLSWWKKGNGALRPLLVSHRHSHHLFKSGDAFAHFGEPALA